MCSEDMSHNRHICISSRFLAEEESRRNSVSSDQNDMKIFHDALKTIYGPKSSEATTLLSADGSTLLTDKEAILEKVGRTFQ